MNCIECDKISNKKNIIYEDSSVIAMLVDKPSALGHMALLPKQHAVIIEQIPDDLMEHMFSVANKLSAALFDVLGSHGTNILIQNGMSAGQKINHAVINIIPRMENDGLSFHWQTIKMSEDELNSAQMTLKEGIDNPREAKKDIIKKPKEPELILEDEDNYLLKQLERMP